jgi:hypothetical protein
VHRRVNRVAKTGGTPEVGKRHVLPIAGGDYVEELMRAASG